MSDVLNFLARLEAAPLAVEQRRCVRVRNRNAKCMRCLESCAGGCIGYEDNEITVDPTKCIGCGTCATVCPTDAIHPKKPTDAELAQQCLDAARANSGRVVIACKNMLDRADGLYDRSKVVRVPCLGRVDESLVLHLAVCGAQSIRLVRDACDECAHKKGSVACQHVCASANELLEAWNAPQRVSTSQKLPGSVRARELGYDQSRRAFFATVREGTADAASAAVDTVCEDKLGMAPPKEDRFVHVDSRGTLPHEVSQRRKTIIGALDVLESRYGAPLDTMIDTRLWGEVLINTDECRGCRMCATFCPTGANFKFQTKSGSVGVKHRVLQCANCRLCLDICPDKALQLSEEVFARDISDGVTERYLMGALQSGLDGHDTMASSMRRLFNDNVSVSSYTTN